LPPTTATLPRGITRIRIRGTGIAAASAWLIARISIGHATATTAPARLIAWVGIGALQRTTATRNTTAIARFIPRIGIGFTAAALFGAWLVLTRQFRFRRRGRLPALRQGASRR
jgi:hypothetical protein